MSALCYKIEFRPTLAHANTDGLSRLPLQQKAAVGNPPDPALFNVRQINILPVTAKQLAVHTLRPSTEYGIQVYPNWMATGDS